MKSSRFPKTPRSFLVVLALAMQAACSNPSGAPSAEARKAADGPVALTVNGEAIAQPLLDAFAQVRGLDLANPQQRERATKQLVDLVLVDQFVAKQDFGSDPAFAAMIEIGRLQAVSASTLRHLQATLAVDDAAVREEYERQVAKSASMTYTFSQLVYADEAAARKALKAMQDKPFDLSLDSYRKAARTVRSFSNLRAAQLSPDMATVIGTLKPGDTVKEPVQLPQGWTILRLSSSGMLPPPAFEQLKDPIRRQMLRRVADERLAKLREGAAIVVADAPAAAGGQSPTVAAPPAAPVARSAGE